jgi:hypothetical protein
MSVVYDVSVLVKETAQWLYAGSKAQCVIKQVVAEREWLYCFELKGVIRLGLHVEKRDSSLQISVVEFDGTYHADVFAFGKPVFRNVGGAERRLIGASRIVEIPTEKPKPPAPPTPPVPPEIPSVIPAPTPAEEPITVRLDVLIKEVYDYEAKLDRILEALGLYPVKANSYSVVTIDLGTERASLAEYPVAGFAMTVYKCDGTFELKLGDTATDTITVEPLTYPSMLVFDRVEFSKFFVKNAAQAGRQAILIVWRRE